MIRPALFRIMCTGIPHEARPSHRLLLPGMRTFLLYASLMLSTTSCGVIDFGKKMEYPLLPLFIIPPISTFA
jgi:hypothetical protein